MLQLKKSNPERNDFNRKINWKNEKNFADLMLERTIELGGPS